MTDDPAVLSAMVHDLHVERPHQMTLLDRFACEAMGAMLHAHAASRMQIIGDTVFLAGTLNDHPPILAGFAALAYDTAEAMLKERARRMTRGAT